MLFDIVGRLRLGACYAARITAADDARRLAAQARWGDEKIPLLCDPHNDTCEGPETPARCPDTAPHEQTRQAFNTSMSHAS